MRNKRLLLSGLAMVLGASIPRPVQAQEVGFYKDLKIRLGYSLQAKDHLRQSSLGFGLNLGYAAPFGKLALELGYFYKTGDQYLQPVSVAASAPLSAVDLEASGDSRRNQLDGFALRLSYARSLGEDWQGQAGLMVGGTRFKHEYVGDVRSQDWTVTNADSWRDTYAGTPQSGGLKISPYVGASTAVTKHSSLEFNLMILSYEAMEYVHHAGTGTYAFSDEPSAIDAGVGRISEHNGFQRDTTTTSTRYLPHLEIGYVIHF